MTYPLAALEELRERERDDAARQLADAISTVAECAARVEAAARAHQAALDALAAQQVLDGSGVATGVSPRALGGADLQLRVAYRQRLAAERDARATELATARQRVAEAQAAAETAREALAACTTRRIGPLSGPRPKRAKTRPSKRPSRVALDGRRAGATWEAPASPRERQRHLTGFRGGQRAHLRHVAWRRELKRERAPSGDLQRGGDGSGLGAIHGQARVGWLHPEHQRDLCGGAGAVQVTARSALVSAGSVGTGAGRSGGAALARGSLAGTLVRSTAVSTVAPTRTTPSSAASSAHGARPTAGAFGSAAAAGWAAPPAPPSHLAPRPAAPTCWAKRSSGSFARARATTSDSSCGTPRACSWSGGAGSLPCFQMSWNAL